MGRATWPNPAGSKVKVRRVAFFYIVAVGLSFRPAAASAQWPIPDGTNWQLSTIGPVPQQIFDDLRNLNWSSGSVSDRYGNSLDCGWVRAETMRVLDEVVIRYADPVVTRPNLHGQFFGYWTFSMATSVSIPVTQILINRSKSWDYVLGTIIHESMHSAQFNDRRDFGSPNIEREAALAIDCFPVASEEEEDGAGVTFGGGGNGPRIISKKPHVSIPRVWVIRYIPGGGDGPAVNVEIGELEVICDYDTDDDAWKDCPDADKENA